MRKEIYLIKGTKNEGYEQFSNRILELAKSISQNEKVSQIRINYTAIPPPKMSVIPFKKNKVAAFSVYFSTVNSEVLLKGEPGFSGGFLVEEALPVAYEKSWEDGAKTPGVCLLTLFQKKKNMDYNTFIHRWHNGHTPLSLKIHPLWNYNRNVVMEKLTDDSYEWDGIVEEHFRTSSDLLNPAKFFGNPLAMIYNMLRVYFDTHSFIDYKTIEPHHATEIWIKS
jgi:hypothetical protein